MSLHQHATISDTVYFWFAANDTSGSGADGASPVFYVRLAGAAAGAAPVLSDSGILLTDVNFPPGAHEVAIAATVGNGFAAGNTDAVFCTLLVDSQNPTGFVGSFILAPIISDLTHIMGTILTEGGAGRLAAAFIKLLDVATPNLVASDAMRGTDLAALAVTALTDATWTNAKAAFIDAAISGRGTANPGDAMNLAADAIKAVSYDESTAFPVVASDAGSTQIARTGADSDTLETLSDEIATRAPANEYNTQLDANMSTRSSHSAANVWAVGSRTLTSFGSLIADIWAYVTRTLTAVTSDGATETKQDLIQADLDTITGSDGATLATLQALYAPSKAGDLMGLIANAITAAKYDESTAWPITASDAGVTQIARTGADGDTLETLSDQSDVIQNKTDNLPSGIAKNVALDDFGFLVVLTSDHVTGATGLTVAGQISKDGGAFGNLTNSVTEVSAGLYKVDITQAEMNADSITLKFTATTADQRTITIFTS